MEQAEGDPLQEEKLLCWQFIIERFVTQLGWQPIELLKNGKLFHDARFTECFLLGVSLFFSVTVSADG